MPSATEWITRPACLDKVNLSVSFSQAGGVMYTTLWAEGRCDRRRGSLWSHSETYQTIGTGYVVEDAATQVVRVAALRKPRNQTEFDRAMNGNLWDEDTLPGI